MAAKKKNTKLKSLSHGRPPTAKKPQSISSKATRTLIRTHHTLQKRRGKALAEGDEAGAAAIAREIELQGGLDTYQRASLTGQHNERGGDSSKILMEWLSPAVSKMKKFLTDGLPLKMLEVGALSTGNACSRSRVFQMERIDLNSQSRGIQQQDFMERPLPRDETEAFDIISLSLVLNYVPDAVGKGEMLRRTLKFLKPVTPAQDHEVAKFFPSLFFVLPAPCINNSRYMDEARLEKIMRCLGYELLKKKISNKLLYQLWQMQPGAGQAKAVFKKEEIRTGQDRNNFAIVLK